MVEMIPRLVVLSIIAVAVFGVASAFYSYNVSVRDVEARLLGFAVADCLSEKGVINLEDIGEKNYDKILSYCGLAGGERVYVGLEIMDLSDKKIESLYEGDSGLLWVRDFFEKVVTGEVVSGFSSKNVEKIIKYNPGYYDFEYPVFVVADGREIEGKVKMEVLINYEDE
jgi:hypothetical protein